MMLKWRIVFISISLVFDCLFSSLKAKQDREEKAEPNKLIFEPSSKKRSSEERDRGRAGTIKGRDYARTVYVLKVICIMHDN